MGLLPIELHCDLEVDAAREASLLATYRGTFRPAIRRQAGFVNVKLLKLRTEVMGSAPSGCRYRLVINFETEEQRQAWIASDLHEQVWDRGMNTHLTGQKAVVLLYDEVP